MTIRRHAAVVAALRDNNRFVVTSHEALDGDALGSLLGMGLASVGSARTQSCCLGGPRAASRRVPVPGAGEAWAAEELPPDFGDRVLVAVDCASASRVGAEPGVVAAARFTVNIDHHHDNPRFGDVNLIVAEASSTGEVLADVFEELGVALTPEIAEALYIALVTDTGRFQYANTTPKALRLAAELVESGADVHRVFQGVYENVQFAKLKLLARALERARVLEGGEIVVSHLLRDDFEAVGASSPTRGIIDVLRSVEGSAVSALIREPRGWRSRAQGVAALVRRRDRRQRDRTQVGRRSHRGPRASRATSRSRISPTSSCARSPPRSGRARSGRRAARALNPSGIILVDKPAGPTSFAIVAATRRLTGARTGHAGTLDPFATGLLLLLSGASTRLQPRFVGMPKRYETAIDLTTRTSTGDVDGEPVEEHDPPDSGDLGEALDGLRGAVDLPIPAVSAVKIDGQRAYALHRRGVAVEMPVRTMRVHERSRRLLDGVARLELHVVRDVHPRYR